MAATSTRCAPLRAASAARRGAGRGRAPRAARRVRAAAEVTGFAVDPTAFAVVLGMGLGIPGGTLLLEKRCEKALEELKEAGAPWEDLTDEAFGGTVSARNQACKARLSEVAKRAACDAAGIDISDLEDIAEGDNLPIVKGRIKALEERLAAAGVVDSD